MPPRRQIDAPIAENALVRTVAAAGRKLTKDLPLSRLQAIDRLQKLHKKFESHWYGTPWLVLENGSPLPASMSVPTMLEEMGKHGDAIGICGVAQVTSRQDSVLVMPFRKDERSRKLLEATAQAAKALVDQANEQIEQERKERAAQKLQESFTGAKK